MWRGGTNGKGAGPRPRGNPGAALCPGKELDRSPQDEEHYKGYSGDRATGRSLWPPEEGTRAESGRLENQELSSHRERGLGGQWCCRHRCGGALRKEETVSFQNFLSS